MTDSYPYSADRVEWEALFASDVFSSDYEPIAWCSTTAGFQRGLEITEPARGTPSSSAFDHFFETGKADGELGPRSRSTMAWLKNPQRDLCPRQARAHGTHTVLFYRWADPYPRTVDELEHGMTTGGPNDQQRLVAGMLDRGNLLDLIRTYTLFSVNDKGETIKIVGPHFFSLYTFSSQTTQYRFAEIHGHLCAWLNLTGGELALPAVPGGEACREALVGRWESARAKRHRLAHPGFG